MRPRAASLGSRSGENCCASSHSMTCGFISASANSRTVRRRICCSSDGRKSIERRLSCRYAQVLPSTLDLLSSCCLLPSSPDSLTSLGGHHRVSRRHAKAHHSAAGICRDKSEVLTRQKAGGRRQDLPSAFCLYLGTANAGPMPSTFCRLSMTWPLTKHAVNFAHRSCASLGNASRR